MAVKIEVWGDYACFTRPEMKVERVSYDVMTPSAARGIIEAIYYHPGLHWLIDRIHVLNPIRFTNIRRNEVADKASAHIIKSVIEGGRKPLYINAADGRQQRAATVLQDVRYLIEAHFEMTGQATAADNPGKFQDIIRRRLEKGQCFHQPYLGCREFAAHFRPFEGESVWGYYAQEEERDLGYMLFDMDYTDLEDIRPLFFRAVMRHGIIDLQDCEVMR